MKVHSCILSFSLIAGITVAQPTLDSNNFYQPGDVVVAFDVATDGIDDGPDGANQVWDFSDLESLQPSDIWNGTVLHPEEVNDFDFFRDANVALVMENGNIRYWYNSTQGLSQLGQGGDDDLLTLNTPFFWFTYPFTFGSETSQESSGTVFSSCRDYDWMGSSETQGVGYGTLLLPSGTFDDVLKIRRISFTSKTNLESGIDRENSIIEHFWFKSGIRGPLMYMRSWTNNGCPGSNQGVEAAYLLPTNSSSKSPSEPESATLSLQLFPNPANHQTQLSIRSTEITTGMIWVSDMLGQPVFRVGEQETIEKSHIRSINLNAIQPGMYIVHVKTENQHLTEKLIIQ